MRLKKLGIVLGIVMALSAVAASSAFAVKAETVNSRWYVNGSALANNTAKPITCKPTTETTPLTFHSILRGQKVAFTATGLECIGHTASETNAKIENTEPTSKKFLAEDFGKIRFTGVKVEEPAGCKVTSETTTTSALKSEIYEEKEGGVVKAVFDHFEPTSGPFLEIGIKECALETAELLPVNGSAWGLAETPAGGNQATGTEEVIQRLKFDTGVDETATGEVGGSSLFLGKEKAHLMGTIDNELVSKEKFGAKEN